MGQCSRNLGFRPLQALKFRIEQVERTPWANSTMTVISGQRSAQRTPQDLRSKCAELTGQSIKLAVFFLTRDFTIPNQQGSDVGNQY